MDGDSKGEFGMNACYVDAEIWTRHNAERRKLRQDIASHKKKARILLNLLQNIHHVVKQ